jgi:hypothetical protein
LQAKVQALQSTNCNVSMSQTPNKIFSQSTINAHSYQYVSNNNQTIKGQSKKNKIVYTPAPMPVWSLLGDFLLPWTLVSWWMLGSNLLLVAES